MLGQRRRRWANIKTAFVQRLVSAGDHEDYVDCIGELWDKPQSPPATLYQLHWLISANEKTAQSGYIYCQINNGFTIQPSKVSTYTGARHIFLTAPVNPLLLHFFLRFSHNVPEYHLDGIKHKWANPH